MMKNFREKSYWLLAVTYFREKQIFKNIYFEEHLQRLLTMIVCEFSENPYEIPR